MGCDVASFTFGSSSGCRIVLVPRIELGWKQFERPLVVRKVVNISRGRILVNKSFTLMALMNRGKTIMGVKEHSEGPDCRFQPATGTTRHPPSSFECVCDI